MTTKETFEGIISKRNWYVDLEYPQMTANSMATRFRKNKLSIEKMEEVITRAGYHVIQEKQWGK